MTAGRYAIDLALESRDCASCRGTFRWVGAGVGFWWVRLVWGNSKQRLWVMHTHTHTWLFRITYTGYMTYSLTFDSGSLATDSDRLVLLHDGDENRLLHTGHVYQAHHPLQR